MQKHHTCNIVSSGIWMWIAIWWVAAVVGDDTLCCNISIGDNMYREEVLVSNVRQPSGLAVDYTANVLYCSYLVEDSWHSGKVDPRTNTFNNIEELSGRCTFAVDQARQQVHVGCGWYGYGAARGLYQLDPSNGQFVEAGEAGQHVWFVYYKDALYYTLYNAPETDPPSEVCGLVIDKHADWIFYNRTGVYRRQAGAVEATRYEGLAGETNTLAVDARGYAYACEWGSAHGIWRLHEQTATATRLLEVGCNGLTFDRDDNIIYGDYDSSSIIRLVKC